MRDLVTGLLTLLFIAGFFAFFLLGSLLGFAREADRVVGAARDADLRGSLVDAASELAARELNDEGGSAVPTAIRPAIADVISQEWFDDTLRTAHGALLSAVDEGATTAVYDLRPLGAELRRAVDALASRATRQCERFLGEAACRDREAASEAIALQRVRANNAIAQIPRRVDVVDLLGRAGRGSRSYLQVEKVRQRLGDLRAVRWVGLALLVGCMALIAFVNLGSTARVLGACAGALVAASIVYLVAIYAARGPVGDAVLEKLAAARAQSELDAPAQTMAAGVDRFALRSVEAATGGSTGTVALLGVIGLGVGFASAVAARQSGRH